MKDILETTSFDRAMKRLAAIRSFYRHVMIYVTINVLLAIGKFTGSGPHPDFWNNSLRVTLMLGMLGLLAHAGVVYGPNVINKKGWEQRKLAELLEKDKKNNNNQKQL